MRNKPRILIARAISPEVVQRLQQHFEVQSNQDDVVWSPVELAQQLQGKDGVLTTGSQRIDAELLAACPQLKIVANMAVGYNNFDVPAMTAAGVQGTNAPDVLTETTADFGFALLTWAMTSGGLRARPRYAPTTPSAPGPLGATINTAATGIPCSMLWTPHAAATAPPVSRPCTPPGPTSCMSMSATRAQPTASVRARPCNGPWPITTTSASAPRSMRSTPAYITEHRLATARVSPVSVFIPSP